MHPRSVASTLSILLVALAAIGAAPRRHVTLVRSEPAKDTLVAAAPTAIRLWFNEQVPLGSTRVRLMREGTVVALDSVTRASAVDAPMVAPIRGVLPDGQYTVQWATASKDGHPVQGSFKFTVRRTP